MRWHGFFVLLLTVLLGAPHGGASAGDSSTIVATGLASVTLNTCTGPGVAFVAASTETGFGSIYADNGLCAYYIEIGNCAHHRDGLLHCRDMTAFGVVELTLTPDGHLRFDAGFPGGIAAAEGDLVRN